MRFLPLPLFRLGAAALGFLGLTMAAPAQIGPGSPGAGGGGGTVTQGPANGGGSAAWFVQWSGQSVAVSSLPSLPAGTNSIGAVTQGAAGATPWLVSWSAQSVAVSSLPSLPAGANVIGAVTQSGGPWTISGTVSVSNFPGTQPVSAASLPLPTGAATSAGQTNTAAGTSATTAQGVQGVTGGVPLPASEASGANVTLGATTDAPLSAPASTTAASLNAIEKGVLNALLNGTAKSQTSIWYTEASALAVGASGTTGGLTQRSSGSTSGSGGNYGYFTCVINSTQSGTLIVYNNTLNNATYTAAVTAGIPTSIKIPALGTTFSSQFNNGTTAATVNMIDGFTVN